MDSLYERVQKSNFASFIARYFPGEKVQKISLSASSACPLHGKERGEVCTYCSNRAFSPAYALREQPIDQQLAAGIDFFRYKYPSMKYLAYFQSYTTTYASRAQLIDKFRTAAAYPGVVGIVIATRPDLMPEALLDELTRLAAQRFVMVEYGIESTLDRTLRNIHRGHDYATACDTIRRTASRGIPVGAHLILGLPGETRSEMLEHAIRLNELPLDTLKLHQLQILRGSPMATAYQMDPSRFKLFDPEEYIELCLDFLAQLKPSVTVERFIASAPDAELIAPRWGIKNYAFTARLLKAAQERESH